MATIVLPFLASMGHSTVCIPNKKEGSAFVLSVNPSMAKKTRKTFRSCAARIHWEFGPNYFLDGLTHPGFSSPAIVLNMTRHGGRCCCSRALCVCGMPRRREDAHLPLSNGGLAAFAVWHCPWWWRLKGRGVRHEVVGAQSSLEGNDYQEELVSYLESVICSSVVSVRVRFRLLLVNFALKFRVYVLS